jgi:protein-lysine N-methyltransferase EEF2KMT
MPDLLQDDLLQLTRFCRQYLQLEPDLEYPQPHLLRRDDVQETLYWHLFHDDTRIPDQETLARHRPKVLKMLVSKIEQSIDDWDEHVCSW